MTASPLDTALGDYHPEPEPEGDGPFKRLDLGEMITAHRPRPRVHCGLIYPRKLHTISGEPEAGKSTVAIWTLIKAMEMGRPVALIDSEAGAEHTADLLQSMGLDSRLVSKLLHYYPFPQVSWSTSDVSMLHAMLERVQPVITMFDSSATMLAAAGLRENDAQDVTRLWNHVLAPIGRTYGCSVLVTDHDAKDGFASRYSRGSTGKLAAVDVGIKISVEEPFTRDQPGRLKLWIPKDRPGCLWRSWDVAVLLNPLRLEFTRTEGDATAGTSTGELAGAAAILEPLLGPHPLTARALVDEAVRTRAAPRGLKANTAYKALEQLRTAGIAEKIDNGPGQGATWYRRDPRA